VALSLIGLGLCAYLGFLHIALLRGELLGGSACGAAGTIFNCHAVTASPVGSLFGVPLSLWGLVGYLATASLALIAWQFPEWTSKALTVLLTLGLVFLVIDLALLVVMVVRIRYLCLLCLLTYVVNVGLVLAAKRAMAQPWQTISRQLPEALGGLLPRPRAAVSWLFWAVVLTGVMGTVAVSAATRYLAQGGGGTLRKQMAQFVSQQRRVSVDAAGDPLFGLPNRPVQVVVFSDFLCPSCQRAAKFEPIMLAGHRQEVAFVFKHFPLDKDCNTTVSRTVHAGACQIAAATECAHEQGKFWAFHDRVFEEGSQYKVANLEGDAARLGLNQEAFRSCMQSGRGLEAVKRDVAEGARLGITSTPTYIINGLPITGVLAPVAFDELLRTLRQPSPSS
jgi:protein-disulfide isomerase/uncharacterized membrane protein